MAVPLGGRHYYGNWEYATPEMVRKECTLSEQSEAEVEEAINHFKAYVDERPQFTFERNFDSYRQDHYSYCRTIAEVKNLRIVRPYAKEVHQKFIDAKKEAKK